MNQPIRKKLGECVKMLREDQKGGNGYCLKCILEEGL